jgi:lysylphosphatidylglycerol synthetase-like protein (DUF2156 family)
MVISDLHLGKEPTAAQLAASAELAAAIEAATGPGVLILAGNLIDSGTNHKAALSAHARLSGAIATFARAEARRVIVLPGDRDVRLAWSEPCQGAVRASLGAELALAVDLRIQTGAGERKVRVEPGYRFDRLTAYQDPRNPLESPFAQHIREEVLPAVRQRAGGGTGPAGRAFGRKWLSGLEQLDDPAAVSRFIASRLVYRRLVQSAWLLLVPIVVAFVFGLPATAIRSARAGGLRHRPGLFVAAAIIELLLLVLVAVLAIRVTNRAMAAVALDDPGRDPNEGGRALARDLVTAGYAGLISGHTCRPELTYLGTGFYANAGAGSDVVTEYPSRVPGLGLPSVFLAHRILSWVELEAGNDLHVRLLHARQDLPGAGLVERLMANRVVSSAPPGELRATVVATFPQGEAWPRSGSAELRDRRVRRVASALLVVVGFISLVSAMSDPVRDRLDILRRLFPMVVPETAAAVAAFVGVALIVLARGIRRGQKRAWVVVEALLLASAVLNIVKGVDVEETLIALAMALGLWIYRSSFRARTDVVALRRGLTTILGAALLTVAAGTVGVELSAVINHAKHRVPWNRALEASLYRMIGSSHITLPHRVNDFLAPAMATATVGLVLGLVVVLFRPVVARRLAHASLAPGHDRIRTGSGAPATGSGPEALARARAMLARHGSGTLDYFALRTDKEFFFWGDTVVAFAVYGGVCLVSPDPVGPVAEREEAWRAFRRFVDGHGWALGGLGIGEEWLPIYRATGMHDLYVGDEAVVRVNRFSLDGGKFKGLRQAVNRVAKYGYRISFHDPAHLDPDLRESLRDVMTKSRRGDVERGFSMTLGRVFDPDDEGFLLAVVHGPSDAPGLGPPVAFCQYVPAPGIGGYSLDLMRRDNGEHPNGLIDFAVVETIREVKARGGQGVGLNFATMRAVLAGEAGEGVSQRVQAWLLRRMGDSMQIESLWKFNAKFDPDWQPRYAIYDAPENMLGVAIAVARAESFWELPVIGRFLVPTAAKVQGRAAAS